MTPFIKFTAFILLGSFLGYISAQYVISGNVGELTIENSGWTLWRKAGQTDADPYTKAHFALKRELPLNGFEEMVFTTSADTAGGALSSNCSYLVNSGIISSRSWSLSVASVDGEKPTSSQIRQSFNTDNVVRRGKGSFQIVLSTSARSGNWLPISVDTSEIKLVLVMINPDRQTIEDPASAKLPTVKLETCG